MNIADKGIYEWIKREERLGNIYCEVDGYYVWCPTPSAYTGFVNEYGLLEMAKFLAAKNALWDWQIQHDPAIGGEDLQDQGISDAVKAAMQPAPACKHYRTLKGMLGGPCLNCGRSQPEHVRGT